VVGALFGGSARHGAALGQRIAHGLRLSPAGRHDVLVLFLGEYQLARTTVAGIIALAILALPVPFTARRLVERCGDLAPAPAGRSVIRHLHWLALMRCSPE
jgi:hypothetical protein